MSFCSFISYVLAFGAKKVDHHPSAAVFVDSDKHLEDAYFSCCPLKPLLKIRCCDNKGRHSQRMKKNNKPKKDLSFKRKYVFTADAFVGQNFSIPFVNLTFSLILYYSVVPTILNKRKSCQTLVSLTL